MPASNMDDRREQRVELLLPASVDGQGGTVEVRLHNMSPSGALVEGADLPEVGEIVELRRGGDVLPAIIAWRRCERAGLTFEGAVDVAQWSSSD